MRIVICHERFLSRFGVDRVLLALARGFTEDELRAAISPDGSKVAYTREGTGYRHLHVTELPKGPEKKLVEGIGAMMDWTSGGREILYYSPIPYRWFAVDAETGETRKMC